MGWRYKIDDDTLPTEVGWYPVAICYDPMEGIFPMAQWFDGRAWTRPPGWVNDPPRIGYWPQRFETMDAARDFAIQHDPEG